MQEQSNNHEDQLIDLLNRKGEIYTKAIRLVRSMNNQNNSAFAGLSAITEQVKALMQKVETYSAPISQLRATLANASQPRSERLNSTIAEQENLLRTFIQEIDQTKVHIDGQRTQLLPSLDTEAQRNSMQSAYKRSMSTR